MYGSAFFCAADRVAADSGASAICRPLPSVSDPVLPSVIALALPLPLAAVVAAEDELASERRWFAVAPPTAETLMPLSEGASVSGSALSS